MSRSARRASLALAASIALGATALSPASAALVEPSPDKPDGPISVVYVEVNSNDMINVADYTLEGTNTPVFDVAIIFAANINYDATTGDPYLHLNERVTETLDQVDTQIRPLQEQGTKVLLSILPNHDGAGFVNFPTPEAADAFAQELADAVDQYGLDGIDFDDEYAEYEKSPHPINDASFVWLVTSLRDKLGPDKIISLYDIGPSALRTEYDGVSLGADGYIDYAWNPYYSTYRAPFTPGMTNEQLGAAAVNLTQTPESIAEDMAQRTVDDGMGVYLTYNLTAGDHSEYISTFTRVLYGRDAAYQADPILEPSIEATGPVTAGEDTRVELAGFAPGESVTVTLDGSGAASVVSDESGSAQVDVTVPASMVEGTYELVATGDTSGARASAELQVLEAADEPDTNDDDAGADDSDPGVDDETGADETAAGSGQSDGPQDSDTDPEGSGQTALDDTDRVAETDGTVDGTSAQLAATGADLGLIAPAALLLLGGAVALVAARHRRQPGTPKA